jgi:hypothetical protein
MIEFESEYSKHDKPWIETEKKIKPLEQMFLDSGMIKATDWNGFIHLVNPNGNSIKIENWEEPFSGKYILRTYISPFYVDTDNYTCCAADTVDQLFEDTINALYKPNKLCKLPFNRYKDLGGKLLKEEAFNHVKEYKNNAQQFVHSAKAIDMYLSEGRCENLPKPDLVIMMARFCGCTEKLGDYLPKMIETIDGITFPPVSLFDPIVLLINEADILHRGHYKKFKPFLEKQNLHFSEF